MRFCDADACCFCHLKEGEPDCLRRKAEFCFWLRMKVSSDGLGAALQKLGTDLIRDAEALRREQIVFSRRKARRDPDCIFHQQDGNVEILCRAAKHSVDLGGIGLERDV